MKYKEYILKDIATIQTGPFGSQLHQKDYIEGGTPIITVEHLGENKILHNNLPGVKKEDVERLSKYSLIENDIVFSRVGSVDRRAIVSKEEEGWLFSGRCLRVRVTSELVNPLYLSYYFGLSSFKKYIRNIAVGATMPSINTKILSDIKVLLPDLERQNEVIKILHSIDSKIWINYKLISNFEKLSHILFKQWFIDFEFPNEQGLPYNSSGGKMVESELGIIPEGWNVKSVADISEIMSGGTPRTSIEEYWNGSIPFFTPKDVDSSYYTIFTEKHVTEAGLAKCASKLYPINTIFITARGTVGKLALAGTEMAMNQSCYALKHKSEYQYYLYLQLNKLMRNIIQSSNGAVFNAINVKDFNSYKLPYATNEVLENFEAEVAPLFKIILNLSKENDELSKLRDTLLPKLLSGEIDVPVLEPEQV